MPDFNIEMQKWLKGYTRVAGVDEAGRGSWSGPVVAAAVIFDRKRYEEVKSIGLNDSKKLTALKRNEFFEFIYEWAEVGIGSATPSEIDNTNILLATFLAMQRAINDLINLPDFVLVDGDKVPPLKTRVNAVIKGDAISVSIAAASIIAKVTRDRIMVDLSKKFPEYCWEKNKGYGTDQHKEALKRFGVTEYHRKSYKPIINILSQ